MLLDRAQDIVATMVAAGALGLVIRHVLSVVRPRTKPECAKCPLVAADAKPERKRSLRELFRR